MVPDEQYMAGTKRIWTNDVISFSRKCFCALGLELGIDLELGLRFGLE